MIFDGGPVGAGVNRLGMSLSEWVESRAGPLGDIRHDGDDHFEVTGLVEKLDGADDHPALPAVFHPQPYDAARQSPGLAPVGWRTHGARALVGVAGGESEQ